MPPRKKARHLVDSQTVLPPSTNTLKKNKTFRHKTTGLVPNTFKVKKKVVYHSLRYEPQNGVLYLQGKLTREQAGEVLHWEARLESKRLPAVLCLDYSGVSELDSAGSTAVHLLRRRLKERGLQLEERGLTPEWEERLNLFSPAEPQAAAAAKKESLPYRLGSWLQDFWTKHARGFLLLMADMLFWGLRDLFKRGQRRKGEVVNQAVGIGVNAVPIVMVLAFIIGLVLALQSAAQLRNFGANIFIVDLIVIAMMAEMGPLITAIVVAGRSGSSIAAEIATMKVTNETDALQTMGINPLRFVVVPKLYGALLTLPFLTVLANVAGIAGGATAAYAYLDIGPEVFFNRMPEVLYQKDIVTGLVKSLAFATLVVLTGTWFGFQVDKGAEGVGKAATRSVVASIALVIVADLVLGLLFY